MGTQFSRKKSNPIISFFRKRPVLFHLLLWIVLVLLITGIMHLNSSWPFSFHLLNMLVALPVIILFAYTMHFRGNNLLFKKKNYLSFVVLFLFMSVVCACIIPVIHHYIFFGLIYPRLFEPEQWFHLKILVQNVVLIWFPYFILSIQSFFSYWFTSEQEKLLIENKRLQTEIQLMKIKLHPHFLFNTLNNLYAMSKKQDIHTSDYILQLSDIYRIMLYECNKDYYSLNNEITLIKNYIDLERIRYGNRLELSTDITTNIHDNIMIPPLLLFTFVENAFKHGIQNDTGNPKIYIKLKLNDGYICFYSSNSLPEIKTTQKVGGFGLDNTNKRLKYIYEDDFNYIVNQNENEYNVSLEIPELFTN